MLSVLMQVFVTFSMIVVLWCLYGYSLAFTEGNAFIGGFDRLFMKDMFMPKPTARSRWPRPSARASCMPELLYMAFQATFAAITCCLIVGAFAERMKFSAVLCLHGAVVHLQLLPDRAHGLVLARPRRVHRCKAVVDATMTPRAA